MNHDERRPYSRMAARHPAGALWWRLEARARREAMLGAARPFLWIQALAAACIVGLALGLLPLAVNGAAEWDVWAYDWTLLANVRTVVAGWLAHLDPASIRLALIACLSVALLIPLAVYLARSEK